MKRIAMLVILLAWSVAQHLQRLARTHVGPAGGGPGVNVADQADLQRNPLVEDVLREVPQFHRLAVRDGNVFDQSRPMADAMRAAILNGLPDRFLPKSLAGMNRNVEILPLNIVKSIHVLLGRIAALFARQVESHHSPLAEVHGKFGHLERHVHIAHRAND